jgi:hypothetical protein
VIGPTDWSMALRIRVAAHYLGQWSSADAVRVFDPRSRGMEFACEGGWRRSKPREISLLEPCNAAAADVELFTFPDRLALSVHALQGEDVARRSPISDRYSRTLREVLDFLSFAGVTSTSRMVAGLQILKPGMALIGVRRLASPGRRISRTGKRVGVTLMNFGAEPVECIFGQRTLESQATLECSAVSEARAAPNSFTWATPPVAIVMRACEGATALDARQLLGFSTRNAARDVWMMMAEACS